MERGLQNKFARPSKTLLLRGTADVAVANFLSSHHSSCWSWIVVLTTNNLKYWKRPCYLKLCKVLANRYGFIPSLRSSDDVLHDLVYGDMPDFGTGQATKFGQVSRESCAYESLGRNLSAKPHTGIISYLPLLTLVTLQHICHAQGKPQRSLNNKLHPP